MYNLLMAGVEGSWDDGTTSMGTARYLEHTVSAIKTKFRDISDEVINQLMSIPSLFAYEQSVGAPARVGWIKDIKRKNLTLDLQFTFDDRFAPISSEQLKALLHDLDIDPKLVDLVAVLEKVGLADHAKFDPPKVAAGKQMVFIVHGRDEAMKEFGRTFHRTYRSRSRYFT